MKKLLLVISLLAVFATSVFAQNDKSDKSYLEIQRDEAKWSNISYVNVPIMKILEGKDGYLVVYQKNKIGVGNVVIPKSWARGSIENPRKLKFRKVSTAGQSFMTVVYKDGEFSRVILTIPMNKSNSIWGVIGKGKTLEGADKDTLEELEL